MTLIWFKYRELIGTGCCGSRLRVSTNHQMDHIPKAVSMEETEAENVQDG